METTEKKLEKVKRASRTGNKEAQKEEVILLKIKDNLEAGISIRALGMALAGAFIFNEAKPEQWCII